MNVVRTRTHTVTRYANPYLTCTKCSKQVTGYWDYSHRNYPCNHVSYKDNCPSWSPVDDCTCKEGHG